VNYQSLEQIYSSKSDDELLALSADNASLREDAKEILVHELRRRGLDGASTAYDGTENSNVFPQAPSRLLRSLKFGAILILNVCVAVLGTAALEAEIGGAIHPRSITGLLWKWWTLDLLCAALIGFLMWRTWKTEASKWTWTLPAVLFGLRFTFAFLLREQQSVLHEGDLWSQFSGADCKSGWRPGSGCVNFFAFTAPFVRGISFSVGAYLASKVISQKQSAVRVGEKG
jgi:hypothetical protein